MAAGNFFPDILRRIERVAALVDIAELDSFAEFERAAVGGFLAGDDPEQGGLAGAVGADDTDDAAGWQREFEIFEQQFVAISLGQALGLDHLGAEPFGRLDQDLRLADHAIFLRGDQIVKRLDTRLGLGLPGLRALPHPLQLVLDRLLAALVLAFLLRHAFRLGFQPAGVIALERQALAAVDLEHPVDNIVEKIAVMGDENDVAGIVDQMLFQPGDAFGIEMVGRFVEHQDFGLVEQQPAERNAALFTTGQVSHRAVARRAAQSLHRDFELVVEGPAIDGVDFFLQLAHFFHQRVKIGVFRRIAHDLGYLVEAADQIGDFADAVHDIFLDRLVVVKLRLLRQIADADPLARPGLTLIFLVLASHDLHQRRFAGAVLADDGNFRARQELQVDIVQHRLGRSGEGLGQTLHDIAILDGHRIRFQCCSSFQQGWNLGRLRARVEETPARAGMTG